MSRIRRVNDIGLGMAGISPERLMDLRIYAESGTVIVGVVVGEHAESSPFEAIQYLTPQEAMAFAKAFERCAIAALKDSA